MTIRYFFPRTFPNDAVTAVPIRPALKVRYYVMVPKLKLNEEIIELLPTAQTFNIKTSPAMQKRFRPIYHNRGNFLNLYRRS